ncbi:MAG: FAD-dependent oxidoreductase [Clostridia bacterium]|nr:FAD-dependent oxidoreductase [Clostridia bacterium]
MNYDVVIVGGGIGGLMTAYRIVKKDPTLSVCVIDRGRALNKRVCPVATHKTASCIKCKQCAIMEGIGGAGAFSDGKFNITTEYGGWLQDYIGEKVTLDYINQVSDILDEFGATEKAYAPSDEIKLECLKHDLYLLQATVKHLGTDGNLKVMSNLMSFLEKHVTVLTETAVVDVKMNDNTVITDAGDIIGYKNLVLAIGRSGSEWFGKWCRNNGVEVVNNQVDLGVRVELPRIIWEGISEKIYEPKIFYRTKDHGDCTRTFCFNSGGEVVIENNDGLLTVNGHANANPELKTKNSNFSILSTTRFTQPFNEPIAYAKHICKLANMIAGGGVIVQRFGDLVNGKRTNEHRLGQSRVRPTLNAVAGDLSLCIPKRQLDNIIETIYALDKIAPGTANYDTLLYGVEAKFYSIKPKFNDNDFRIAENIYTIGDGAGITRGLAQAGANGLYVADHMLNRK